ncbi:uncharacterized protein LOC133191576 [Saccostrea echinata]|uniref:uncharacterized protein LOC133191576 n=1 Tax=Saccostrea echinata TaxID=191078 RepID=UPI002A81451E|nr:uncharacterized protein LOC133191576 [Saccostrea echinata]
MTDPHSFICVFLLLCSINGINSATTTSENPTTTETTESTVEATTYIHTTTTETPTTIEVQTTTEVQITTDVQTTEPSTTTTDVQTTGAQMTTSETQTTTNAPTTTETFTTTSTETPTTLKETTTMEALNTTEAMTTTKDNPTTTETMTTTTEIPTTIISHAQTTTTVVTESSSPKTVESSFTNTTDLPTTTTSSPQSTTTTSETNQTTSVLLDTSTTIPPTTQATSSQMNSTSMADTTTTTMRATNTESTTMRATNTDSQTTMSSAAPDDNRTTTTVMSTTTNRDTSTENSTDKPTTIMSSNNQTVVSTSDTTPTASMSSTVSVPDTTTNSVGVPNVTLSPTVVAILGMSEDNSRDEPHMVCVFADPGGNLFFLVKWYINNQLLSTTTYGAVNHQNINTTAALKPKHWTANYSMNMNIKCSVHAQYLVDSGQGLPHESANFFAGITIQETNIQVSEGDTTQITLTSSVPVGCSASLTAAQKEAQCKANLHIITSEWDWCWNGVKYLGVAFPDNGCHVSIPYKYWDQPVTLNVTGYVDSVKNWWDRYSRVKFKSTTNPTDRSDAWNNVTIDHIVSVSVSDESSYTSGGGMCGGFNDPHMVTFDRRYWENQRVGEFVMYKHKTKPFAVHALYSTCYPWRAACNCGVAIRSGKNLYVVRTCIEVSFQKVNLLSYPYERYDGCSQEDEITVQKLGTNYRVTLPSGTEVSFSFNSWSHWINYIQIVASPSDFQNTEGICGYYDNDYTNDFIPKNSNSHTSDEKAFALSWRVGIGNSDSLFKKNPDVIYGTSSGGSTPQSQVRYCTCSSFYQFYDQWYNVPFDPNYATCNLEAPTEPCSDKAGQTVNVCSLNRRRRSTADSDDVIDEIEFGYDPEFNPSIELNVTDWTNGWNEENATQFCNESFTHDLAVVTCIEKVNTSVAKYINGCVEDIKMIGNSEFLQATLDTLKKECVTTASRDSQFSNSTTDDGGSILDLLRSLVCPNNCSGQGVCVNETCSCNTGFIGEDCSVELSTPPANITIPKQGVCDTSVRACQKTNIVGTFYSENIIAKCSYFKATPSGRENSTHEVFAEVQYRHINLITVTIPSPPTSRRRKRSTGGDVHGWDIQLSYDNTTYGDPVVIMLFDSTAKSCDTTTFICISKVTAAEPESENNAGIIAGAVIGGVIVIAIIVGIIIYIKMYKRVKGRVSDSEADLRNKDSVPLTST